LKHNAKVTTSPIAAKAGADPDAVTNVFPMFADVVTEDRLPATRITAEKLEHEEHEFDIMTTLRKVFGFWSSDCCLQAICSIVSGLC
jgi:hypothetical protein